MYVTYLAWIHMCTSLYEKKKTRFAFSLVFREILYERDDIYTQGVSKIVSVLHFVRDIFVKGSSINRFEICIYTITSHMKNHSEGSGKYLYVYAVSALDTRVVCNNVCSLQIDIIDFEEGIVTPYLPLRLFISIWPRLRFTAWYTLLRSFVSCLENPLLS